MKIQRRCFIRKLSFLVLISALNGNAQQKMTVISTKENTYCNGTCTLLDIPGLKGNPNAVIFVTNVAARGSSSVLHPVCAYYNNKQWSVMNTDNSTMQPGTQFSVEYYLLQNENHFLHVVSKENLVKAGSYIDHTGLNGNAGALIQVFQNFSPETRGGIVNTAATKVEYDVAMGKWFISNSNGKALNYATGYNISFSGSSILPAVAIPELHIAADTPGFKLVDVPANLTRRVFMTVSGNMQGQFPGENANNRMELTGMNLEVFRLPGLVAGQNPGKREYLPVVVEKAAGPASLFFFSALVKNEQLTTVVFEVYKASAKVNHQSELEYRIELKETLVTDFKQLYKGNNSGLVDSIKFTFRQIDLIMGALSASDALQTNN
jgi:type VI secretion system Hcp family effector